MNNSISGNVKSMKDKAASVVLAILGMAWYSVIIKIALLALSDSRNGDMTLKGLLFFYSGIGFSVLMIAYSLVVIYLSLKQKFESTKINKAIKIYGIIFLLSVLLPILAFMAGIGA